MQLLLNEICVLDLTSLLPGPFCSLLLADMGAEVIKVERPGAGDGMRAHTPLAPGGDSVIFEALNRNKRSVALNLKHPDGREIFVELARGADVVLEGFRPGVMARLGLDYQTLSPDNPSLVYCSLSGYGQDGPLRERAGHDINYLALSGVLGLTGSADGPPGLSGVQMADLTGGFLAALGIVSALAARARSGRGCLVDVSMFDGALSLLSYVAAARLAGDPLPQRGRTRLTGRYPCYNLYQTADGRYMSLGALEPKFWHGFCRAIGRDDLLPLQYAEGKAGQDAINALSDIFRARDLAAWQAWAAQVDVCLEPVLNLDEALAHPHTAARDLLVETVTRQLGPPLKFGGPPAHPDRPAPRLGQHTASLLAELGRTPEQIASLDGAGAVFAPDPDVMTKEAQS